MDDIISLHCLATNAGGFCCSPKGNHHRLVCHRLRHQEI